MLGIPCVHIRILDLDDVVRDGAVGEDEDGIADLVAAPLGQPSGPEEVVDAARNDPSSSASHGTFSRQNSTATTSPTGM
jgi:hypothetical protein